MTARHTASALPPMACGTCCGRGRDQALITIAVRSDQDAVWGAECMHAKWGRGDAKWGWGIILVDVYADWLNETRACTQPAMERGGNHEISLFSFLHMTKIGITMAAARTLNSSRPKKTI